MKRFWYLIRIEIPRAIPASAPNKVLSLSAQDMNSAKPSNEKARPEISVVITCDKRKNAGEKAIVSVTKKGCFTKRLEIKYVDTRAIDEKKI